MVVAEGTSKPGTTRREREAGGGLTHPRTTCKNGHPRSESYIGWGGRTLCRPCDKERDDRWRVTPSGRKAKAGQNARYHYRTRHWKMLAAERERITGRLAELTEEESCLR